ncbi:MAG: 16S rRNA (cytosine(1402)-N(4))-methyltransferase RsmH [Paramuribaculum sp.]|nr:16S rRNA (cytosine(1402)-N(4))-methyltransferase RsmH [Paramuribaculum sp.]
MSDSPYHIPALFEEAIESLDIKPGGTYIDATFGGGGHSRGIIEKLDKGIGRLFGVDQDEDAVNKAFSDERFTIVHSNFRYLKNFMRFYGVDSVDGILADLGVSFHHFDDPERGFSFRWDTRLDMRMNRRSSLTAEKILADYSLKQLTDIFRIYGELKTAHKLASAIVKTREQKAISTASDLIETIKAYINPKAEKKELAMVFQALRIEVNGELEALKSFLFQASELLAPGGRLAIITYHSLEDRIVKNFMKSGNFSGEQEKDFFGNVNSPLKLISSKPIVPTEEEIARNPRSRSAKLRVAVKTNETPN